MVEVQAYDQLVPGIPDEITVCVIAPKLPWTAFQVLARVNRGWRQAIQCRELYDARVRSRSTQTLVAFYLDQFNKQSYNVGTIGLYSVKDGSLDVLPPLPGLPFNIWRLCGQCVFLDGKVYVLGGFKEILGDEIFYQTRAEVYVMDLAGQGQWKQCASMQDPRAKFGCSVLNGKIYVLGGVSERRRVCGCEVYDPTEDAWSPIAPLLSLECHRKVTIVGEELFVHSGHYCHSCIDNLSCSNMTAVAHYGGEDDGAPDLHLRVAFFADVYHPLKNEWRKFVGSFTEHDNMEFEYTEIVSADGKLHKLSRLGLDRFDGHSGLWRPWQSCSFGVLGPNDDVELELWDAVFVDDKILALLSSCKTGAASAEDEYGDCQIHLMRSQRLAGGNTEIAWQEVQFSVPLRSDLCSILPCTIQL